MKFLKFSLYLVLFMQLVNTNSCRRISSGEIVLSTLDKAATAFHGVSTNGGYVGIYSADFTERYGEAFYEEAGADEIWVQPPGTPTVGETFLRAYQLTGEEQYLDYAVDAALALSWGQREEGGWDHRVDVSHLDPDAATVERLSGRCTFDDEITQGALLYLMVLDTVIDRSWLTESIELALNFMMESQFENGGWPQWYPLRGGYHDYYTFNDGAINDNIRVMMHAYQQYGEPAYLRSAEAGGQFIIDSQWMTPQSGWAQQYNHDMEPAWARRFEPPGICSLVTVRNIHTLIDLYQFTGKDKYLEPIPAAVRWLESSEIDDNRWARLYEVNTNRPIYGDREDGNKIIYDYLAVSERERTSYGWQGEYGIHEAIARFENLRAQNESAEPANNLSIEKPVQELSSLADSVILSLNDDGFWVTESETDDSRKVSVVTSSDFVKNVDILCDYLEILQQKKSK